MLRATTPKAGTRRIPPKFGVGITNVFNQPAEFLLQVFFDTNCSTTFRK